jgi:hypothetical protein
MDFREIGYCRVDWIHLAQDRDQWRTLLWTLINFRFRCISGKFLSSCTIGGSSRRAQLHELSYLTQEIPYQCLSTFICFSHNQIFTSERQSSWTSFSCLSIPNTWASAYKHRQINKSDRHLCSWLRDSIRAAKHAIGSLD